MLFCSGILSNELGSMIGSINPLEVYKPSNGSGICIDVGPTFKSGSSSAFINNARTDLSVSLPIMNPPI